MVTLISSICATVFFAISLGYLSIKWFEEGKCWGFVLILLEAVSFGVFLREISTL